MSRCGRRSHRCLHARTSFVCPLLSSEHQTRRLTLTLEPLVSLLSFFKIPSEASLWPRMHCMSWKPLQSNVSPTIFAKSPPPLQIPKNIDFLSSTIHHRGHCGEQKVQHPLSSSLIAASRLNYSPKSFPVSTPRLIPMCHHCQSPRAIR